MLENLKIFRMNNEQKYVRFLIYERGLVVINIKNKPRPLFLKMKY